MAYSTARCRMTSPGLEIVFVEWLLNLAYPRCASMLRPLDGPRGTA